MKTGTPPTRGWLMKAVAMEADCDISAGPVLPPVKASPVSRTANGHARQSFARKTKIVSGPVRRVLAKA